MISDRRSIQRIDAVAAIRAVLDRAEMLAWSARTIRAELREAFFRVHRCSRSVWYAALHDVTGGGVLDIKDARQPELVARGPRAKRKRRKGPSRAP